MSKSKAMAESTFAPTWKAPGDTGWRESESEAPFKLLMTPTGAVIVQVVRGKNIKASNVLAVALAMCGPEAPLTAFGRYVRAQAEASAVSATQGKRDKAHGRAADDVALYYVDADLARHGPYTRAEFMAVIDNGHVDADTIVYDSASPTREWMQAKESAVVAPMLARVPPPVPTPE